MPSDIIPNASRTFLSKFLERSFEHCIQIDGWNEQIISKSTIAVSNKSTFATSAMYSIILIHQRCSLALLDSSSRMFLVLMPLSIPLSFDRGNYASSGHIRLRRQHLVADKGYTSHAFREYLHRHQFVAPLLAVAMNIAKRRSINRTIATRHEKRAANFSAKITIASVFRWSFSLQSRSSLFIIFLFPKVNR